MRTKSNNVESGTESQLRRDWRKSQGIETQTDTLDVNIKPRTFSIKDLMSGNSVVSNKMTEKKSTKPKANYGDALKHPKWQRKRLEIMQRDDFKCCICDDTETSLHIHHKSYSPGKQPWEYPDDNFITLCEDCHVFVEKNKKDGGSYKIGEKVCKLIDSLNSHKMYFYKTEKYELAFVAFKDEQIVCSAGFELESIIKIKEFVKHIYE